MPTINPFIGNFGDESPSPILLPFAGKNPHVGLGKKGKGTGGFGRGFTPIDPGWIAGADTPLINGATTDQPSDTNSNVYSDTVVIANSATETGKSYIEMKLTEFDNTCNFMFGLKNATYKDLYVTGYLLGIEYFFAIGTIRVRTQIGGTAYSQSSSYTADDFVNGSIIGVAIDWDGRKVYAHVNGLWAATGGAPGIGPGYSFSQDAELHLYIGSSSHGTASAYDTFTYGDQGIYVPDGFTLMTP